MTFPLYNDERGRSFFHNVDKSLAYNTVNLWPCSGLYTADGAPKSELLSRWREAVE